MIRSVCRGICSALGRINPGAVWILLLQECKGSTYFHAHRRVISKLLQQFIARSTANVQYLLIAIFIQVKAGKFIYLLLAFIHIRRIIIKMRFFPVTVSPLDTKLTRRPQATDLPQKYKIVTSIRRTIFRNNDILFSYYPSNIACLRPKTIAPDLHPVSGNPAPPVP